MLRLAMACRVAAAALVIMAAAATEAPNPSLTWNGVTTYPTTVTRIWSRTLTAKVTATAASTADASTASITVQTVTMYEPWPSSPDPALFPYTMLQTAITTRDAYVVRVGVDTAGESSTATVSTVALAATAATRTVTTTWLVWDVSPTDLAVGQALPACHKGCARPNLKRDTRCLERTLTTACHSQCKMRPVEGADAWWCQQRGDGTSRGGVASDTREVALGRVCTDSQGYYMQLSEPCDAMDHGHDCPPCNG